MTDSSAQSATTAEEQDSDLYLVPPVLRAITVLRYIAAGNPCRNLSSTAKKLSINRTTLIRIIHTLMRERLIEEIAPGAGYQLGAGLIVLAAGAISNRDVVRIAKPVLAELSKQLNLSAHLGILDERDVVYMIRETPNTHLVSNVREGSRLPAHATTMGRVLLSHLTGDELRHLYRDIDMETFTSQTPSTLEELIGQLAIELNDGIVWNISTFEAGIGSCACAVYDHTGTVIAAINVTGPDAYFKIDEDALKNIELQMRKAADLISAELGYAKTT
ncbi:IclR family transcriptional regulator [Paenochrobactrum glaciei]|uniref:IclR family transcriptional regulator n=1 Tax=Paenochrobactrum glaciei TaxID=486407 RepID=A0ABN1GL63_9HYPH